MRIPINWLKEYVKVPENLSILTDKLTMTGHLLDKVEKYDNETVIDLELRGNRADCYSILGIAREVSAIFDTPLKLPKYYHPTLKKVRQLKECQNMIKTPLVKRVMMVAIKDVKICPSPTWLKQKLEAYGISSINNIVDLTNFIMIELGEPMHAIDLDQIGPKIEVRMAKKGEKMITFLGSTLILTPDDLVWANKKSILSVAGAIGEKYHSISDRTKNIIVEAANYDRANVRRTIRKHALMTDAGIRHEKELDPNLVKQAIYRFLEIIKENNWGQIQPFVFDYFPKPVKEWSLNLNIDSLEKLGGVKIEKRVLEDILRRLNFKIIKSSNSEIRVLCPTYRTDVVCEEDIIEEVLRIYGYDKLPVKILSYEIPSLVTPSFIIQEIELKNVLVSLGFDEAVTFAFTKEDSKYINKLLNDQKAKPIKIQNPPSPDLTYMRMNLLSNLLDFTQRVINERGKETRFFEIGKIYFKQKDKYIEKRKLGIIFWEKDQESFFFFKGIIEALLDKINLPNFQFEEANFNNKLDSQFKINLGKELLGVGEVLGKNIYYLEVDLDTLLGETKNPTVEIWPKFPPIIEDLSFQIPPKTYVGNLIKIIKSTSSIIRSVDLLNSYDDTRTFRVTYQHPLKTLDNNEVKTIREKIIILMEKKFQVRIKTN